jgi:TRAP-type C4-dicarboxylate transport system permease small subunit
VLMMLITTADVILRYTLNRPIRGSYDLVECMLVVFVFHGMAAGFLRRQNIVIDVFDAFLSERMVGVLIRLADVLSIACLLLVAWAMMTPALQAYDYGDRKIELNLPLYILWIAAFAGIGGTLLCALGAALTRPEKSEGGPEL